MIGYIKAYRSIMDHTIWNDADKLKLWLLCLFNASFTDREVSVGSQIIGLKRGQFITSRGLLEAQFNRDVSPKNAVSGKTLLRWLSVFQKLSMLSVEKNSKYTLITVTNWDKYQGDCPNDVQDLSMMCPVTVHKLSIIEELKNVKNVNNGKKEENIKEEKRQVFGEFRNVYLTAEEHENLIRQYDRIELNYLIEDLSAYMAKTGKTYASHYATIVDWCRKNNVKKNNQGGESYVGGEYF